MQLFLDVSSGSSAAFDELAKQIQETSSTAASVVSDAFLMPDVAPKYAATRDQKDIARKSLAK